MQVIASTEFAALITPLAVGKLLGRAFCEWLSVMITPFVIVVLITLHRALNAGFISVRTVFVQNGKSSPFLELTPTP